MKQESPAVTRESVNSKDSKVEQQPAAAAIPHGKAKVIIASDFANPSRVGKTVTVDAEEARVLVAEGRARYHRDHLAQPAAAGPADSAGVLPVVTVLQPPAASA